MGSQQLLLIALTVLIVGFAIVVGTDIFTVSYYDRITEIVILEVHNIGVKANIYRKTPSSYGGGGGSYSGFHDELNKYFEDNHNVKKFKLNGHKDRVDISLTLEDGNKETFRVMARYKPDGLDRIKVYNPNREEWEWYFKRKPND